MAEPLIAVLALLFFAPLSVIYGRRLAGRILERAASSSRSLARTALAHLWAPLFLVLCLAVRLTNPFALADRLGSLVANPVVRAVLAVTDTVGALALVLFFLTIPFLLGRIGAVAALLLGYRPRPEAPALPSGPEPGQEEANPQELPMTASLTIAIDGPAAAGKGTLAKRLATHYALPYLDTGLLYRAVGRKALDEGVDLDDAAAAGAVARALTPSALDDGSLRGREAGELASRVAVHPPVRAALAEFQRQFARQPQGAVLDGRDIGTVICPQALVKIFVTASPEVRALRRTEELAAKGRAPDYERILAEVRERDARDSGRADAPLRPAEDAHLLDTSELDIEAAFRAACDLVDRALARPEPS